MIPAIVCDHPISEDLLVSRDTMAAITAPIYYAPCSQGHYTSVGLPSLQVECTLDREWSAAVDCNGMVICRPTYQG